MYGLRGTEGEQGDRGDIGFYGRPGLTGRRGKNIFYNSHCHCISSHKIHTRYNRSN